MAAALSLAMIEPAAAQTAGIETVLQNIVDMLTGGVARLIAIIAVIGVGIAWMMGMIDFRKAGFVCLGIGIVFGAPQLVSMLSGA
jgi:type IV secretion system protein VirB2